MPVPEQSGLFAGVDTAGSKDIENADRIQVR
jgi:hypothetical protein